MERVRGYRRKRDNGADSERKSRRTHKEEKDRSSGLPPSTERTIERGDFGPSIRLFQQAIKSLARDPSPPLSKVVVEQLLFACIAEEHMSICNAPAMTRGSLERESDFTRFGTFNPGVTLDLPQYTEEDLDGKAESPLDVSDASSTMLLLNHLGTSPFCVIVPYNYKGDKAALMVKHQVDGLYSTDFRGVHILLYRGGTYEFKLLWIFKPEQVDEYGDVLARYKSYYADYIHALREGAIFELPQMTKVHLQEVLRQPRAATRCKAHHVRATRGV